MNAALVAREMELLGFVTSVGFLFEREKDFSTGVSDSFVTTPTSPSGPFEWIRFIFRLSNELRKRRPDYVIGFQPASNVLAAILSIPLRFKLIATQRNPSPMQSRMGKLMDMLLGSTRLYSANICVSETVADSFSNYPQRYKSKIKVVHNATPKLPVIPDDAEASRRTFLIDSNTVALGCVARLHPQKNIAFALETLSKLPNHFHLYLAGTGPEELPLRALALDLGIEERVHFLGSIAGDDLTRFYRSLDLLLFTSIYEGFGRVLVEAMSMGTPILSNDIAITREVAQGAASFQALDSCQWSKEVTRIIDDTHYRQTLVEAGLLRSRSFTTSAMIDGYISTLETRPALNRPSA